MHRVAGRVEGQLGRVGGQARFRSVVVPDQVRGSVLLLPRQFCRKPPSSGATLIRRIDLCTRMWRAQGARPELGRATAPTARDREDQVEPGSDGAPARIVRLRLSRALVLLPAFQILTRKARPSSP